MKREFVEDFTETLSDFGERAERVSTGTSFSATVSATSAEREQLVGGFADKRSFELTALASAVPGLSVGERIFYGEAQYRVARVEWSAVGGTALISITEE